MCDKAVFKDLFMLKNCFDRYKTQEMCDKAVDVFLTTLKFIPDWFVTSKMIKKLADDLFSNNYTVFVNVDSNNVTFFSDKMGNFSVDLNKINVDDVNFNEDDPESIIHFRFMIWHNRFK